MGAKISTEEKDMNLDKLFNLLFTSCLLLACTLQIVRHSLQLAISMNQLIASDDDADIGYIMML